MSLSHEFIMGLVRLTLYVVGLIAFAAFNAAYLSLCERKVPAWFQLRYGPKEVGPFGLLQPVADGVKLLTKQLLVQKGSDVLLFKLAPVMVITPAIMCLAVIPFSETLGARNINLGLLAIFSFSAIHVLGTMLGGWASYNKYASIAAARVVAQNIAYEIPLLLVIVALVMVTRTFNLHEIVAQQAGAFWHWNIFRLQASPLMPLAFLIFFTCMLAESNRAPFDMIEAESELVAGAFTEYSGMGFGLFFIAEYANIVVGCSLATVLFLGGWHCPFGLLPGLHWFMIKMYVLCFAVIWVRWSFPRTQFYGLLNLSWKFLIPLAFVHLMLTAVMLKLA
ncbi:MAG: NADH-quinone oxidoreductase subunit NuoH [Verrucomicrobia bacterium]|nr:MAG: NADH-quinone oxidoreductase subunit NuoH [Verrucomicrobiota bacterium]